MNAGFLIGQHLLESGVKLALYVSICGQKVNDV